MRSRYDEDHTSIQTVIQKDPMVRISVAWRQSSAMMNSPPWYWEAWCFSDYPRLKSFMSGTCAYYRDQAQRLHDSLVKDVTNYLKSRNLNG